ncbi:hypothetical protein KZP23_07485 [Echinicola marina]|uniref:hypothetical protein n=1 Tax=Echinicola marina TaxID=2859768 RepID=UPI001CF6955E|nr:hypothetical protein [Echinicola marina]UCS94842.1 hypothetical protein KZP23_07485 [Echinicola marina]
MKAKKACLGLEGRTTSSGDGKSLGKDTNVKWYKQEIEVFNRFFGVPQSMLQVALQTDVLRANICRYVDKWLKEGKVKRVYKGICPITKRKVGKYSTDPKYWEGGHND